MGQSIARVRYQNMLLAYYKLCKPVHEDKPHNRFGHQNLVGNASDALLGLADPPRLHVRGWNLHAWMSGAPCVSHQVVSIL